MANASSLGPDDVLFALSYSGASIETLRIAELARQAWPHGYIAGGRIS